MRFDGREEVPGVIPLEKELITLKDDLEEAHQKLEKSDAAKSQFVFILTHELRRPLSAIESILGLFIIV